MSKRILVMVALVLAMTLSLSSCGVVDFFKGIFFPAAELDDAALVIVEFVPHRGVIVFTRHENRSAKHHRAKKKSFHSNKS